ncbi:MAG: hypothetical protein Q9225_002874 [Loekoesia sp. 1 TL-2023]
MALLIALLALSYETVAAPSISLPINAQVPPVARTSQAFNFTFADTTFSSSAGNINFALANAPGWLQLDTSSRTFSGTPGPDNAGSVDFGLIATDNTGSTTMPVTLVVSSSPGPGLGIPIEEQLSSHSGYQAPDTLLLLHSSALSVSFSPDTFTDTSHDTVYYALCANNTPLPSWINFDPHSLSFAGSAPQNTSPDELPQTFDIRFTASDVVGFSAAVASFRVILENHILTFGNQPQIVNITQGVPFTYKELQSTLLLDGATIDRADIRELHIDKLDWVSFDETSWILSGTPPNSTGTQNITVTATDIYGENATTTIILQVATNGTTNLFQGPLGIVNATVGQGFDYTFNKSIITASEAEMSVDLGAASSWLKFDQTNLELSGHVPSDLEPQDIILNVTLSQGSTSQSEPLTINVESATHSSNSRSTGTPNASVSSQSVAVSPTSTSSSESQNTEQDSTGHRTRVAAAIAVPVAIVCLFLIFACCFVCRRRRRPEKTWLSVSERKISRPFRTETASDRESIGEMIEKPAAAHTNPSSRAPVIDLPAFRSSIAGKRRSIFRLSRGTTDEVAQAPKTDSWHEYIQGLSVDKPKKTTQPQFSLVPEEQASSKGGGSRFSSRKNPSRSSRPSGVINTSPTKRSKQKQRRSDMSFASTCLLSSPRVSGFGHGQNGSSFSTSRFGWGPIGAGHGNRGPPQFGRVRESWRNPSIRSWAPTDSTIKSSDLSSSSYNGSERLQNIVPSMPYLPRPPTPGTMDYPSQPQTIREIEDERRPSIRAVPPETPQTYGLPLHAFHKRRARDRHHRNTFFSAGPSSRASSHLNWMLPVHSPILSPTQSLSSLPSSDHKNRISRVERLLGDLESSSSSSLDPQNRPSTSRGLPRRGLANLISTGITSRFHSSRSSIASSQRFASAAEDSELGLSPGFGLKEDTDEEGNRQWRPEGSTSHVSILGEREGWESLVRTTDRMGRQLQRLTLLRQQGRREESGGERRFVVGGSRGKRPVSVDNGLVARGPSMRGDVVEEGEVAFL